MTSPTQRSLALLRQDGYTAQVVEKWNPYAKIRQDLFGFVDVVAIKEGIPGVVGIQTTSRTNILARMKKILGIPAAKIWLQAGNKIIVHGWGLKGTTGKRKTYQVRVEEITIKDFI